MTAEIAILNKTAVALATDSAVTISAGAEDQKIYDSADKLFDISDASPMGIMIYNGMQFMQAPLPMLIADYRERRRSFDRIENAAKDFLCFLSQWGSSSPAEVSLSSLRDMIDPAIEQIKSRIQKEFDRLLRSGSDTLQSTSSTIDRIVDESVSIFEFFLSRRADALFLSPDGNLSPPTIGQTEEDQIRTILDSQLPKTTPEVYEKLLRVGRYSILKDWMSGGQTGIVIAGFGRCDMFPSLVSYEIDGMAFGKLKFTETNSIDIDRQGERARVLPFAQKEMVERFLYGLDGEIERTITQFCKQTVPSISAEILGRLEMGDDDLNSLRSRATEAQDAFINELQNSRFADIRSQSRSEIEDMVEFMPKPELATMAEALVNLTSIKRRVSRGMETVGGPIDVAVISRSEGFIWIKRKHYFDPALNPRYMKRVRDGKQELPHGSSPRARGPVSREQGEGPPTPRRRDRKKSS